MKARHEKNKKKGKNLKLLGGGGEMTVKERKGRNGERES